MRTRFLLPLGWARSGRLAELIGAITPDQLKDDFATGIGHLRDAGVVVPSASPDSAWVGGSRTAPHCGRGTRRAGGGAVLRRRDPARDRRPGLPDAPLLRRARRVHPCGRHREGPSAPRRRRRRLPERPARLIRDGSPNYDEDSATDTWKRMLGFFGEHLELNRHEMTRRATSSRRDDREDRHEHAEEIEARRDDRDSVVVWIQAEPVRGDGAVEPHEHRERRRERPAEQRTAIISRLPGLFNPTTAAAMSAVTPSNRNTGTA